MKEENTHDVFIELAKAKNQPMPLKVSTASENDLTNSEEAEGQLTVDVYQTPDEIIVRSAVAGVANDDLEIHITNESVTIRGTREQVEEVNEKDYFYQECFWGTFSRSVILPQEVDPEESIASLKNGILTIRMPKVNKKKIKKLKVKSD